MKPRPDRAGSSESGYVIIVLLASVLPLAMLVAVLSLQVNQGLRQTAEDRLYDRLLMMAEGAAYESLALVNAANGLDGFPLASVGDQHASDGRDNDGDGLVDEADEVAQVRVITDWRTDLIDNDGDGVSDEGDEDVRCLAVDWNHDSDGRDNDGDGQIDEWDERFLLTLVATATHNRGSLGELRRIVELDAQYTAGAIPEPAAALYFADPQASFAFNGLTFLIDGRERTEFGSLTGHRLPAIGIESADVSSGYGQLETGQVTTYVLQPDGTAVAMVSEGGSPSIDVTANLRAALSQDQQGRIVGLGDDPSVHAVQVPSPYQRTGVFIDDFIYAIAPTADLVFEDKVTLKENPEVQDGVDNDGDGWLDEEDEAWFGNPATDDLMTIYAKGDLKFSGNGRGAGLLMVEGNLELSGQFQWDGIVVVKGNLKFAGGGSEQKLLRGCAYVGGGFDLNGNVTIEYSASRMQQLLSIENRYGFLSYRVK